jgi:quercetin dioxygenase-like cupin family protein
MSSSPGPHDLPRIAWEALASARQDPHGRHADLLLLDGHLRQSVIALASGARLADHNAPPAATLQVLQGAVEVTAGPQAQVRFSAGQLVQLPRERHGVLALEDAVFLLTTVTGLAEDGQGH